MGFNLEIIITNNYTKYGHYFNHHNNNNNNYTKPIIVAIIILILFRFYGIYLYTLILPVTIEKDPEVIETGYPQ